MIADMLASPEFALIAAGLQLANLFIKRMPQVFANYFRKEGVLFHLQRLGSLASENVKHGDVEEESQVRRLLLCIVPLLTDVFNSL